MASVTEFSPSKSSHILSSDSGDSFPAENHAKLHARLPNELIGELYFLDDATNKCFRIVIHLICWCHLSSLKCINSELTKFDFSDQSRRKGLPLAWVQRLKIAVDVARGLNYLHLDRAIPHGNLKSTNVLLDTDDLNARVADYCLHILMTQVGTIEQILHAGVLGYCAPELATSKKPMPSFKSDIYASGVILLELLTGRCAGDVISGEEEVIDLTNWVRLRVAQGRGSECFDAALMSEMGNSVV